MSDETLSPDTPPTDGSGELQVPGLGIAAWFTDVGHVRTRNEDRFLVKTVWAGSFVLILVADGAGGHDSGDKAAQAVVDTFGQRFPDEGEPPDDPAKYIREVILEAHGRCKNLASGQARPPAATVVAVLLERASLSGWRFHVGDSRLYVRTSDGTVAQWTRDHNITNGLIDRGLPVSQALKIADGGRLTQILGGGSHPDPEIHGPLPFEPGQTLMVCSDGAYGHNGDREILPPALDPAGGPLLERAQTLMQQVLAGDAPDNLTAVLWQTDEDAEITAPRSTVTNSMKAVSVDDVERRLAAKVRADLGLSDDDEDDDEDDLESEPTPTIPAAGWALIGGAAILLGWLLLGQCGSEPEPMVQAPAPTVAPAPTAAPTDPAADAFVASFDPAWWGGLPPEDQSLARRLLGQMKPVGELAPMLLRWTERPDGQPVEAEMVGWPMPGGANADVASKAWKARERVFNSLPELAGQAAAADLLQRVACAQVQVRWPLGTGEGLADWLAGCLPETAEGDSIRVRLGGWPDRGWTSTELNELQVLAAAPDGAQQLLASVSDDRPRTRELARLASALGDPRLADLAVELLLVLPSADAPPAVTPAEAETLAAEPAVRLALLLRGAAGDGVTVEGVGTVSDELTDLFATAPAGGALEEWLAGLNRRLEVVLSRPSALEPDEPDGAVKPPVAAEPEGGVATPASAVAPVGSATAAPGGDPARSAGVGSPAASPAAASPLGGTNAAPATPAATPAPAPATPTVTPAPASATPAATSAPARTGPAPASTPPAAPLRPAQPNPTPGAVRTAPPPPPTATPTPG